MGKMKELQSVLMYEDSLFIHIPKDIKIEPPYINDSKKSKVIIYMEPYSQLTYIGKTQAELVEIHLDLGAHLYFINLDGNSENTNKESNILLSLKEEAISELFFIDLSKKEEIKRNIKISLIGEKASSKIRGLYLLDKNKQLQYNIIQNHIAPFTASHLVYKGILRDDTRLIFKGEVIIEEDAEGSDAYQANHALILGKNPTLDFTPILEIKNNNLKRCTHGTTAGKIDEEMLFYMNSRGLDKEDALRLISEGFLRDIIDEIPEELIKAEVLKSIETGG